MCTQNVVNDCNLILNCININFIFYFSFICLLLYSTKQRIFFLRSRYSVVQMCTHSVQTAMISSIHNHFASCSSLRSKIEIGLSTRLTENWPKEQQRLRAKQSKETRIQSKLYQCYYCQNKAKSK